MSLLTLLKEPPPSTRAANRVEDFHPRSGLVAVGDAQLPPPEIVMPQELPSQGMFSNGAGVRLMPHYSAADFGDLGGDVSTVYDFGQKRTF